MRDIRDVLRDKELQLEAVRRQVEALRVVVFSPGGGRLPQESSTDQIIWKDATTGRLVTAWP